MPSTSEVIRSPATHFVLSAALAGAAFGAVVALSKVVGKERLKLYETASCVAAVTFAASMCVSEIALPRVTGATARVLGKGSSVDGGLRVNPRKLGERPPAIRIDMVPEPYAGMDCEALQQSLLYCLDSYGEGGHGKDWIHINDAMQSIRSGEKDLLLLKRLQFIVWRLDSDAIPREKKGVILQFLADKFGDCQPTWNEQALRACMDLMDEKRCAGQLLLQYHIQRLKEDLILDYLGTHYQSGQWHDISYVRKNVGDQLGLDVEEGRRDHYGGHSWSGLSLETHRERSQFVREILAEVWTPENMVGGLRERLNQVEEFSIPRAIQELFNACAEAEMPHRPDDWDPVEAWYEPNSNGKLNNAGVRALLVHQGYLI